MRCPQLLRAAAIAAFLAFHLLAVTVCALPAPDAALDRAAWRDPTVQEELASWRSRLGVRDPKKFEDRLYRLASLAARIRGGLLRPFNAYYQHLGTYQSWQMFVAPYRYPARLRIEVLEPGGWRIVYREGDPHARWLAAELSDTRFRSVLFRLPWPSYLGERQRFADFVARRASGAFPRATEVRVVFSRSETPTPAQARRGEVPPAADDPPLARSLGRPR